MRRMVLCLVVTIGCHHDAPIGPAPGPSSTPVATVSSSAPATSAPDTNTHASTTSYADASPARVSAEGKVDGESLRQKHHARLPTDKSPVVVLESTSRTPALDLGQRLCEAVVPERPKDTPILLKPNLGGFEWFRDAKANGGDDGLKGRTTDPEFVRGVLRCLKARGHTRVTIAEGWGAQHSDWEHLVRANGYAKMAEEEHVPLVALDDDGVFDVQGEMPGKPLGITGMDKTHVPTLLVPKLLAETLDHGLFISLPKIKAHRFGVFSISIKGMQGTVDLSDASPAFHQKWRMHEELGPLLEKGEMNREAYIKALETFATRIADVLEVEAPDVVLAEGAPAMGGDGFGHMWPSAESFAIGGTNAILVDRVGAEMLGLWNNEALAKELGGHRTSPLLEAAAKRFDVDLDHPTVTGDGAHLLESPRPIHYVSMAGFTLHSDDSPPLTPAQVGALGGAARAQQTDRPVAHAVALGDAQITIDGKGDDPVWSHAPAVTWDTDYAGHKTPETTEARFVYGPDGLYVLWNVHDTGLFTDKSRPTNVPRDKLYDEDCVEIFLTPDKTHPARYFETEVGPFGHYLDAAVDLEKKKSDTSWSSGARIAVSQDAMKKAAVIEAKLTAPDIVRALKPGATLPLGLYRMEGAPPHRKYLAWSPPLTDKPNFHVPEAFGSLILDP
jgi:uncharacterized protein (DUF362 family)